jgi:hypothetical protein
MTYPHPREPRRASKSTYFVMGAIFVVLAIAAFFFVLGVKEDSENPVEGTGQPASENPLSDTGTAPSNTGEQEAPAGEAPATPGATGTNQ